MERILRFGPLRVRFDPERLDDPQPDWFDPEWWARHGHVDAWLGGRGQAVAVSGPVPRAVLRVYRRGGWIGHFVDARYVYTGMARTRPWREWHVTRELWLAGLPVPQPLAAAVWRRGAFYRGALLTARIEPARTLAAGTDGLDAGQWHALGRTLARFTAAGLTHPDLNAGNVLHDGEGRFWLVDFDRATLDDRTTNGRAMLRRLLRSLAGLGLGVDERALRAGWAIP